MIKKCIGCGITLQWEDENKLGYIKKDKINEVKYCQRCFRLMHYNEMNYTKLPINQKIILKNVNDKKYLVFFLVDLFNINKEVISTFNSIKNSKCLVISKTDLLPKSFNFEKIKLWLNKTYHINDDIIFLNSLKKYNINKIFKVMDDYKTKKCFMMGYTNSGKSTLLNTITGSDNKITTSMLPNTTLNFINIYYDDYIFIDTPGFDLNNKIYDNDDFDFIKKINNTKFVKPGVYQMQKNSSILIENKIRIKNLGNDNSFIFYMSNNINLNKVYENNDRLEEFELKTYHVKDNTDLVIKGLGFINIKKSCELNIYTLNHSIIEFRKSFLGSDLYE